MERELTVIEAASIIVGAGVGGGIMAVPWLAEQAGTAWFVPIIVVAFAANVLLHLMLAEVLFRDGQDRQVVELIRSYVFRGRWGEAGIWLFFSALLLAFIANLTAYISGAGEILADLLPLPLTPARFAAYLFSAAIVFFGLKMVGVAEKMAVYGTLLLVAVIGWGAAGTRFDMHAAPAAGVNQGLALYGMVMYSLYAFFAVPQVVKGLGRDRRKVVASILLGLSWNAMLIIFFVVVALGVPATVTEIAITGISRATGRWVGVAGSLFILLAMLTSYWSVSLALADIIHERLHWPQPVSWLLATAPTALLIGLGLLDFLDYLRLAGGVTGLIVVVITIPMYVRARRSGPVPNPALDLGRWGSAPVLWLLLLATLLMAVGSLLST